MTTHIRAWCAACHGNTLHHLQPFDERLWGCFKCSLNGRTSVVQLEEEPMTIEAKLDEMNTNLKAILAALQGGAVASKPAGKGKGDTPPASSETPAATLTYDQVKTPFLDLVKTHGRETALGTIAAVDASLKSLKDAEKRPDLFGALLDAIKAAAAKEAKKETPKTDDLA